METQDLLSIVTISVSTILSIGAIVLSIVFYKESNKQNKETALMQSDIRSAIMKLEHLYDRTYTDTFGALKNQMDAMQKHIFTSSVGNTNSSEPNQLRFSVLGCVTEKVTLDIEDLYSSLTGYSRADIKDTIYTFHREKILEFDGEKITYLKPHSSADNVDGQEQN